MKRNRFIIIIILALAVIAATLLISRKDITFRRSQSDFSVADTSAVTMIFMADKNNNEVTLARQTDGRWKVDGKWFASKFNLDMLLQTLHNLALKEPVPLAARDNIIREMAVNAVKVEIYQKVYRIDILGDVRWFPHEKLTKVFYVGGATQSNRGSYMLMDGSDTPFVIYLPGFRGFVSPRFTPMVNAWRDYNIFREELPAIASVRMEINARENESFLMTRDPVGSIIMFTFPGMERIPGFDTLAVLNFLAGFRNLSFEGIPGSIDRGLKDSILASVPFTVITLTDTAGRSKTFRAFFKAGSEGEVDLDGNPVKYDRDRFYALVNNGEDFVVVQYFAFDRVLRPRSFFIRY